MSEWTVNTLRELMEQRFTDSDKAIQAALQAAKEAVGKAEIASEKRFDSVNEFRQSLSDQTATFIPRTEYDVQYKSLDDKVNAISKLVYVGLGIILAIQFIIGIIVLWATHAIK
jgi:hypothetical protein